MNENPYMSPKSEHGPKTPSEVKVETPEEPPKQDPSVALISVIVLAMFLLVFGAIVVFMGATAVAHFIML